MTFWFSKDVVISNHQNKPLSSPHPEPINVILHTWTENARSQKLNLHSTPSLTLFTHLQHFTENLIKVCHDDDSLLCTSQHPLTFWHTLLLFDCKDTNISDGKVQFITCMADLSFYLNSLRVLAHKMDADKVNVWTKWISTVMAVVHYPALTKMQSWSNTLITRATRTFSLVYTTTLYSSLLNTRVKETQT